MNGYRYPMVEAAHSARFRAASLCCGILVLLALGASADRAEAAKTASPGASISIIGGKATPIEAWPWQVALTAGGQARRNVATRELYFCAGSLIAPDLVITAAHCIADLSRSQRRQIKIVSGRSRLNSRVGATAYVTKVSIPRFRDGRSKYSSSFNRASWDVALLKLKRKLPGEPIMLPGATEDRLVTPGRLVRTTGWGVTNSFNALGSATLRVATQVILPDAACSRENGPGYQPLSMICLGAPAGNSSSCFGDSGGPMVARLSTGWRLIGVTSFGDAFCTPTVPSVDTRVAGLSIRAWVRQQSLRLSGYDPIGVGGVAQPLPRWCRIPKLSGRSVPDAKRALRNAGCRLGRVAPDRYGWGRRGRVSVARLPQDWLAPIGARIGVWVNR